MLYDFFVGLTRMLSDHVSFNGHHDGGQVRLYMRSGELQLRGKEMIAPHYA